MKVLLWITSILLCLTGKTIVYGQIHGTYPKNGISLSLLRIAGAGQADTLETVTTRDGLFRFKTRPQQAEANQKMQSEKDMDKLRALKKEVQQLDAQYQELIARYIRKNQDNLAGVFLVWDKMEWTDIQELEKRYRLLDDKMQNTPGGKAIRKEIDKRWRLKPGIIARNFMLPDTAGKPVKLSGIPAKVKLLDFWASWCIPCRNANKKLISLYEKYKSYGLEIVSISIDKNKQQWKRAVRQDGCKWIQLLEQKISQMKVNC